MVLDEFAGLRKMDRIESGIAEIAKYGVKLFLVLQSLPQLKSVYGDNWETFLANCGTKVFFGVDDHFTREYVSKLIGETEVVRTAGASTRSTSSSRTQTDTSGETSTREESTSRGSSDSYKRGPFILRDTMAWFRYLTGTAEASDSRQTGSSTGSSTEASSAKGSIAGTEHSSTRTEHILKRPLVTPDEVGKYFRRVTDRRSNLYPGMAIGIVSDYPDPLLLRRCNYFDSDDFSMDGEPAHMEPPGPRTDRIFPRGDSPRVSPWARSRSPSTA